MITAKTEAGPMRVGKMSTVDMISAVLVASSKGRDLILSPGHHPHVKLHGKIVPVRVPEVDAFSAEDIQRMATDIIGENQFALQKTERGGIVRRFV